MQIKANSFLALIVFLCASTSLYAQQKDISKLFEDKGFIVYYIKNNYSESKKDNIIKNDANQTAKIITKHMAKSSWIIVDHYDLGFKWEKSIRKFVDKIIVCFFPI